MCTADQHINQLPHLHFIIGFYIDFKFFFIEINHNMGTFKIKTVGNFFGSYIHSIVQCLGIYFAY